MGHDTSELCIISLTVREAFGAVLLAVAVGLVCRTPTFSRFSLDACIELVG